MELELDTAPPLLISMPNIEPSGLRVPISYFLTPQRASCFKLSSYNVNAI